MQKEKLVPAIRFKGFEECWKPNKFSELFEEKRVKTTEENEDTLLSCTIDDIYLNSELFSHFRGSSTLGYIKVTKYDLILSAQNLHLGNANVNLKYESGIISPAYKAYKITHSDPHFIQTWVKKENTKKFFLDATTEGASGCRKNVEWNYLYEQFISIPILIHEQQKIGQFFSRLDSLISSQVLKLEKLQTIKHSLLSKMFASYDQKMPEIRFKDFLDAWNHKLVKSLGCITTGNSNTQDSDVNGAYPFFIRSDKPLKSNKYLYDEEAVITIGDGNIGKVFHYVNGKFDLHQRCYKISNFTDVLGKYFYWYFSSNFYDRVIRMSAKATVDSVRLEMIADMEIYYPSNKNEQSKISTLLDGLDSLIHSQEQKLEKLNSIKQALLEKMFC
ncbi:restriction endonuclease subunit S [Mycoplasma sp. BRA290]|uniref:restriction endonuclease subunit S n=1 Tax=Mycoplasma sp. BRA290 TaxID=3401675 RepID=UPI003AAEEF82